MTVRQINQIEILLNEGVYTLREIAERCNTSKSTVCRIKKRLETGEEAHQRTGSCGRKRVSRPIDDRCLLRMSRKDPTMCVRSLTAEWKKSGITVSKSTTHRRLKEAGYTARVPRKVPILTSDMKKKRLNFAMAHRHWTANDWQKVRKAFD